MRPTTPATILADAFHRSRYPEHPVGCSCQWAGADELEALEVYDRLVENGAHVAYDLSLPTIAPSRGPRTSDTAAESIDNLNDRQWAVWWALSYFGPMTDESLAAQYGQQTGGDQRPHLLPPQTPQSIRTRRKELERAGHVRDSGERRLTKSGRPAIVWAAVGEARAAA